MRRSSAFGTSGPTRSHGYSMRFRSGHRTMPNPVRLLIALIAPHGLALSCWNTMLGVRCNRLHNLCDVAFRCQTAVKVHQMRLRIIHYAIPIYDVRRRIGLTIREMSWFVRSDLLFATMPVDGRCSSHKHKRDSSVINTRCYSIVQVRRR
ncbi:hypothetical protein TNCV_2084271 [Trichonephila clavipes]|uniref:Uncharacterized protein n=1 Tax=Trichonephila clavipes TaxID=2585209 RepID=A0A8X6RVK2_TRICX|nr:hypothetical protein TNCV_2084271 [Trichonephila clavipes]